MDHNSVPEGHTLIGVAKTDFGEIQIYKDFSERSSAIDVLISGLFQFYKYNHSDGEHYHTIINILPAVGTTSEIYPINNQREGFRPGVNPEIEDMMFFLSKIDALFNRGKIRNSFNNSFSMDAKKLEVTEGTTNKTQDQLVKEVLDNIKTSYKTEDTKDTTGENTFGISLDTFTKERQQSEEKRRNSSWDSSNIDLGEDADAVVDTSQMPLDKPVFHNNTNFKPSDKSIKFMQDLGAMMIQLRDSILQLNLTDESYTAIAERMKSQYWGISLDSTYNGVNVSPRLFNFLAINPISMVKNIIDQGTPKNIDYTLTELILHNILHEMNHNAQGRHDENFTVQFQYTYMTVAALGDALIQWKESLRQLINDNLKELIEDGERFKTAKNIGDTLKGSSQRERTESEKIGVADNGKSTDGQQNKTDVSELGKVLKGKAKAMSSTYGLYSNRQDQNMYDNPSNMFSEEEKKKAEEIKNHCKG